VRSGFRDDWEAGVGRGITAMFFAPSPYVGAGLNLPLHGVKFGQNPAVMSHIFLNFVRTIFMVQFMHSTNQNILPNFAF